MRSWAVIPLVLLLAAGIVPPRLDAENIGLCVPIDEVNAFIQSAVTAGQ